MPETIGQQLKQARLERHLNIGQVVESIRIRAHYIEAIEGDEFDLLPSPVQARAFLRNYAEFLGLTLEELIARQAAANGEAAAIPGLAMPAPIQPAPEETAEAVPPVPEEAKTARARVMMQQGLGKLSSAAGTLSKRFKKSAAASKAVSPTEESEKKAEAAEAGSSESPAEAPAAELPAVEEKKEPRASQTIFSAIGDSLQKRREMLSLTLEEIERHTHVRTHYLKALEEGDFDHLPSSVQGRGMLNNYARFLDMDVDGLLLQFAEGLQALRLERQPQPAETGQVPVSKSRFQTILPPAIRRYLSMDIVVGGGLVVLLLAFAIWGTSRIIGVRGANTPQPTAPSISDILGSTPAVAPGTPSPITASGTETFAPAGVETAAISLPAGGPGLVHVVVVGLQSAWVRVIVDGKLQFEGRVTPGKASPYDGNTQIEVLTGNGAAVSIIYNESDLGPMGALGEVVDHIYTADAILNPTPTFTPSPTITPKPSITPRPSATLRPSSTPRFTRTPTK